LQKAGAEKVSSGVLHYKPTKSQTGYKPDYFVEQVDKWIVYPWEEKEYTP
jgi:hypoxanthine phosphoribosyltransferase